MMAHLLIALLLLPHVLFGTLIGNPALPALQTKGALQQTPYWLSFRSGYFGDYVYRQRLKDEFTLNGCTSTSTHIQTWTQAGIFTLNIKNRIDFYGILGGLRLKVDEEIKTQQQFAWGVGGKVVFLEIGRWNGGCDIKFFQSNQSPKFFECEHSAYNVVRNFHYDYNEFQTSVGIAYKSKYISPYANGSYLITKLQPNAPVASIRLPEEDFEVDAPTKSVTTHNRFGLALGATVVDHAKGTLSVEWRAINQNSINMTGELRF